VFGLRCSSVWGTPGQTSRAATTVNGVAADGVSEGVAVWSAVGVDGVEDTASEVGLGALVEGASVAPSSDRRGRS
jgi:hypothetical protein